MFMLRFRKSGNDGRCWDRFRRTALWCGRKCRTRAAGCTSQEVREPQAGFWVDLHGKLTSQRSLLTKSKRKVRGQPDPTSHPVGPVGQIIEIMWDRLARNDVVLEKLG